MSRSIFTKVKDKLSAADWRGYLLVVGLCLIAVWPFVSRESLPQETDAELHIYRLAELSRLVRDGVWYPRWSPNFYFGYGYPIFNYYAPLSYYMGLPFDFLPYVGPVGAVKSVFVLGILLAGIGMYGFVRDNFGRAGGLVAAVVYVYSPYIQYIDPHARGVLAESFSFGVLAMVLWAFDRLRRRPSGGNWVAAVFGMAAIVLTHNLMAMVFAGVLLGWVLWQMAVGGWRLVAGGGGSGVRYQVSGEEGYKLQVTSYKWLNYQLLITNYRLQLLLAYILGIALAAFFWLPVALERGAVNLGTLVGDEGSHFDFRQHFLGWEELFGFSMWLDWGASEPFYVLNLGVAQWVLGGIGLVVLGWRVAGSGWWIVDGGRWVVGEGERQVLFFGVSAVGLVFLMLPVSEFLWEAVPLLPFVQFPWRLLGAAVAMLAVVSGYGVSVLVEKFEAYGMAITAVAIVGVIGLALPLTQVPPWPEEFGETSVARVVEIEIRGRWLGTTSTADFVPATVDIVPEPNGQLLESLFANETPDRTNYWSVESVGATAAWEQIDPLYMRYVVNTPEDFLFRLFLFAFPGWEARVNGKLVEIEVGRPEGFVVVPVPAGEHVVEVEFMETGVRGWSWVVSGIALIITLGVGIFSGRVACCMLHDGVLHATCNMQHLSLWWLPVLLLGVFVPLDRAGVLRYESVETVAVAERPLGVDFGGQIGLLGVDVPERLVRAGESFEVTVYWSAQQELDINYQSFIHVLAADGFLVAQSDKLNPSDFPTRRWPLDKYVRDSYVVTVPEGVAPGTYQVAAGLWVSTEGWRLPVLDGNGEQVGDNFVVGEIEVVE